MAKIMKLTAAQEERLVELSVYYNPDTGGISSRRTGVALGFDNGAGYIRVRIGRKYYYAHRLAWFLTHGEFPACDIDHINKNKADNRIANLRLASRAENVANAPARSNSRSGVRGVRWHRKAGKWCAAITVNGSQKHLGLFEDLDAASKAYARAAREAFGEFARAS